MKLPAKVVLADMPIGEYISSLVVSSPLSRLKETIRLSNFVTLMEKTSYAHNTIFKTGCPACNQELFYSPKNEYLKKSPDAYIEVLSGDKNFLPINQKIQYFADRSYQTLLENKEYKQVLIVCNSFQLHETVKLILENDDKNADYDGYDFMKYKDELKREFSKNQNEYLEKIALLEVLHEVFDNGTVKDLSIKGKLQIDIEKYITHIDHYNNLLSFESISPNIKFQKSTDSKNIKNCISNELVFGLGEDKEYVEEQSSDQFFSLLDKNKKDDQISFKNKNGNETIIETNKKQKSQQEIEELQEEIQRHEEKFKAEHYIDKVYNSDQLQLLKKIVDEINNKTLFIQELEEQRRLQEQKQKDQTNQGELNIESSEKKNKFKFKKSFPRQQRNTSLEQ